ncbi:MAG: hypothetical protein WB586_08535 [Chthoniobacterales bacterium]
MWTSPEELNALADNLQFRPVLTGFIGPAILVQPAVSEKRRALPGVLAHDLGHSGKERNVDKGSFLLRLCMSRD